MEHHVDQYPLSLSVPTPAFSELVPNLEQLVSILATTRFLHTGRQKLDTLAGKKNTQDRKSVV
jgi:hypothetical protein